MSDEKRTSNLMKTLLNSGNTVEDFEKIVENCQKKNIKYIDSEFYPQTNILNEDKSILKDYKWNRIEDQYPSNLFGNISPDCIQQGELSDCYLIVSLIYTAHDKELVKCLFHPKSSLEIGCVLIYFNFLGERIPVMIDTQIPYRDSKPIFSHPRSNTDSCWFVLVEKAFAKACGGYYYIENGQTHFGIHILFDQFPTAYSKIEDIIIETNKQSKKRKTDLKDAIFEELLRLKNKNAMIGTSVSMSFFPNYTSKELQKATGLVSEHAYQVLDIRETEKKRFLKIRNPWGKFEWKGAYSNNSKYWTETLKKELNYSKNQDGSFWMLYDDFLSYFKSISFSLPKEKDWKEYSVYGKIEGYLDGRSPCSQTRNVGCIPQWSIKFTQPTIVRLSYDVAGPLTYHGLYICKNHGRKVDSLGSDIEMMRITTNTIVNGIEYEVKDFSEPFTFFLNRSEIEKDPCYYRILIESPDKNFSVKKFDDDFLNEKWNSVSYQGMFTSPSNDQWDPFGSVPLTTCSQWHLHFPDLKSNEQGEIRIQLFKNVSEGPLFIILAKTGKKISYALKNMKYFHFTANSVSDYEEFSVPVDNKIDEFDEEEEEGYDRTQWVICVYRMEQKDVSQFKFVILSKTKIEFGLLPEPDPFKNCGYTINGKFLPGKNDGASPYEKSAKDLKQWCIIFKKSPTIIFIDYSHRNASSLHSVYLERKDNLGEKIDLFFEGTVHFDFDIPCNCYRDRITWKIEDISKPYSLCVTRDESNIVSEYVANIFGNNHFEMFEIEKDGIGQSAQKYNANKAETHSHIKKIDFPDIKYIEQPINFKPMKTERKNLNEYTENQEIKQSQEEVEVEVDAPCSSFKVDAQVQTDILNDDLKMKNDENPKSKCCYLI